MGKVKEQIVLAVKVPGYQTATKVTVDYESIWTDLYGNWKFQTWFDYCKQYINVQGKYCKDGRMSLKNICTSTTRIAEEFYHYPCKCKPVLHRIDSYM